MLSEALGADMTSQTEFVAIILADFYADLQLFDSIKNNMDLNTYSGDTDEERWADRETSLRFQKTKLMVQLHILIFAATGETQNSVTMDRILERSIQF